VQFERYALLVPFSDMVTASPQQTFERWQKISCNPSTARTNGKLPLLVLKLLPGNSAKL
jgi:hypothetical protein